MTRDQGERTDPHGLSALDWLVIVAALVAVMILVGWLTQGPEGAARLRARLAAAGLAGADVSRETE